MNSESKGPNDLLLEQKIEELEDESKYKKEIPQSLDHILTYR